MNKVLLIGKVESDPDFIVTKSQQPMCRFSVATNDDLKSDDAQATTRTQWHNIVLFGSAALECTKSLHREMIVYVEGSIHTREYHDITGVKNKITEVIPIIVRFLTNRENDTELLEIIHEETNEGCHCQRE